MRARRNREEGLPVERPVRNSSRLGKVDLELSGSLHLARFLNVNRNDFFSPFLGEVMATGANGKSLYRAFTAGMRERLSRGYQFEWNYTLAKDLDDSNGRDPFADRAFDTNNLQLDYALSDRDIRHHFNFFSNVE